MATMKCYKFGLYNSNDELIDQTELDENDNDFAWETFDSFADDEGYASMRNDDSGYYVALICEVDEEI